MSSDKYLSISSPVPLASYRAMDVYPDYTTTRPISERISAQFYAIVKPEKEIIVADKSVIELLAEIERKQDPELKAHYTKCVLERQATTNKRHVANVISFAA